MTTLILTLSILASVSLIFAVWCLSRWKYCHDQWTVAVDGWSRSVQHVEGLETEARQAREFIAAVVIGAGGELIIPDDVHMQVTPQTTLILTNDRENRLTRLRVK